MYLNEEALAKAAQKRKKQNTAGVVVSAFFGFALVGGLVNYSAELRAGIPVYVIFLIPGLFLLWRAWKKEQQIKLANRYNSIFSTDTDGFVHLEELTRQTGKSADAVLGELEQLFSEGFFRNATLQKAGQPGVILQSQNNGTMEFLVVSCPNCGAQTRIRKGFAGVCEYCGSHLKG